MDKTEGCWRKNSKWIRPAGEKLAGGSITVSGPAYHH